MLTFFHGGDTLSTEVYRKKKRELSPTDSRAGSAHLERLLPTRLLSKPAASHPYPSHPKPAEGQPMRRTKNSSPRETAALQPHSIHPPPAGCQPVRRAKISSPQETAQLDPHPSDPLLFRTTTERMISPTKLRSSSQPPRMGVSMTTSRWSLTSGRPILRGRTAKGHT